MDLNTSHMSVIPSLTSHYFHSLYFLPFCLFFSICLRPVDPCGVVFWFGLLCWPRALALCQGTRVQWHSESLCYLKSGPSKIIQCVLNRDACSWHQHVPPASEHSTRVSSQWTEQPHCHSANGTFPVLFSQWSDPKALSTLLLLQTSRDTLPKLCPATHSILRKQGLFLILTLARFPS